MTRERERRDYRRAVAVPPRRELAGFAVAAALVATLTAVFSATRESVHVATALALYLLAVVTVAAVGGLKPALLAAVASPLLANWFLVPPLHHWQVNDAQNLTSLIVFVAVAVIVSTFVAMALQRAAEAERAREEAAVLAGLAGLGGPDTLQAIVDHLLVTFGLDAAAVLEPRHAAPGYASEASAGSPPITGPDGATDVEPLGGGALLAVRGRPLSPDDRRVLHAFTEQLSRARERARLAEAADKAEALARADALRTALLRAVSHDLRTPLAGIKASVSTLRQPDVDWPADTRAEFLQAIEDDTDRLTDIVTNLLDVSRLQAGAVHPSLRAIALEEVVPAALHSLGGRAGQVDLDLPPDLPDVVADPALLERVVANVVANALAFSPADTAPCVAARHDGGTVRIDVVDHGPGIRESERVHVLQPFHRSDDSRVGGIGLGLTIADGFTTAMGGHLSLGDTPGGGLTVSVVLPVAEHGSP